MIAFYTPQLAVSLLASRHARWMCKASYIFHASCGAYKARDVRDRCISNAGACRCLYELVAALKRAALRTHRGTPELLFPGGIARSPSDSIRVVPLLLTLRLPFRRSWKRTANDVRESSRARYRAADRRKRHIAVRNHESTQHREKFHRHLGLRLISISRIADCGTVARGGNLADHCSLWKMHLRYPGSRK